jgi:radical SAM-linked protein
VSFGLALPTGAESTAEYLDIELTQGAEVDLEVLPARLSEALPEGVDVGAAAVVVDGAPSLQEAVSSCTWRMEITGTTHADLASKVAAVMTAGSLVITRNRKGRKVTDDLRPGILALCVIDGAEVECELVTQPRAVRPAELVQAIDPGLEESRVRRINQWIERDGARGVPLDATDAPHARPAAVAGARARAQ